MMRRAGSAWAAGLLTAVFCAPGCGGDAGSAAAPQAGIARFALSSPFRSLDPRASDSGGNATLQRQVYEGLTEWDYRARPLEIRPLLAASWESDASRRHWRFRLRADAAFYDPWDPPLWPGRRRGVTAGDVLYSWLLQADPTRGPTSWFAFEGLVPGLDRFRMRLASEQDPAGRREIWGRALAEGVEGLKAADDRTLEVDLARSATDFLAILATPYAAVVPREALERDGDAGFAGRPVGSGPFLLAEWVPASLAVFRRVPGWRGQPDPFGGPALPVLEELRFSYVKESSTLELLFRQGETDRLAPKPDMVGHLLPEGRLDSALASRGVVLLTETVPNLAFLAFNMADPVVGQVPEDPEGNEKRRLLRHALARAFPYSRWKRVMRAGGAAVDAATFLPPGVPGAELAPPLEDRLGDLTGARKLLALAGFPEGRGLPVLRFDLSTDMKVEADAAALYLDALRQIGIEARAVPHTWSVFKQMGSAGTLQIFLRAWTMDWPDATNLLGIFYGPNAAPGPNYCHYADAEYDRLFQECLRSLPGPERNELVRGMLARLHHDLPGVPLDHSTGFLLLQPWLKNVVINPFDPLPAKYLRIEGR